MPRTSKTLWTVELILSSGEYSARTGRPILSAPKVIDDGNCADGLTETEARVIFEAANLLFERARSGVRARGERIGRQVIKPGSNAPKGSKT